MKKVSKAGKVQHTDKGTMPAQRDLVIDSVKGFYLDRKGP